MDLPKIVVTAHGPEVHEPSVELLERLLDIYEREVAGLGGPAEQANSGLPREKALALFSEIGLTPPDELVALFGWHDGVPRGLPSPFPRLTFAPLAELCAHYESRQRLFARFEPEDLPDVTWGAGPGWFPLAPTQYTLAVSCLGQSDEAPLVRFTDIEFDEDESPRVRGQVSSLCTVVSWWIQGIRAGAHRWNPTLQIWETDDSRLPSLQRESGVV